MNFPEEKILVPFATLLLGFGLGYLKDYIFKIRERRKERKLLLQFLSSLINELKPNVESLLKHINDVSKAIAVNPYHPIYIRVSSHTGGIISRLSKIDSEKLHKAIIEQIRSPENQNLYQDLYLEIDYYNDLYKRILESISNYQKSSVDLKKEFRSGLYSFIQFHAPLLTRLQEEAATADIESGMAKKYKDYVQYVSVLHNNYIESTQTEDLRYHYDEYLDPISSYVIKNLRTMHFADEVIKRIQQQEVIMNDIAGNASIYSMYYNETCKELRISLVAIDSIIKRLKQIKI